MTKEQWDELIKTAAQEIIKTDGNTVDGHTLYDSSEIWKLIASMHHDLDNHNPCNFKKSTPRHDREAYTMFFILAYGITIGRHIERLAAATL